jgi:hypothetical protein
MAIFGEVASAACAIPALSTGDAPRRSFGSGQWAFLGIMQLQPVKPRSRLRLEEERRESVAVTFGGSD